MQRNCHGTPLAQDGGMNTHARSVALVVDDEPGMVQLASRTLERQGWRVIQARDGGEANAIARSMPIDLLVTDVQMPVMTGNELAAAVRPLMPALKILYVTGFADALFESRAALPEGEAFLEKPYTPRGLLEATALLAFGTLTTPEEVAVAEALAVD